MAMVVPRTNINAHTLRDVSLNLAKASLLGATAVRETSPFWAPPIASRLSNAAKISSWVKIAKSETLSRLVESINKIIAAAILTTKKTATAAKEERR